MKDPLDSATRRERPLRHRHTCEPDLPPQLRKSALARKSRETKQWEWAKWGMVTVVCRSTDVWNIQSSS
jgi:hypothetical protein